MAEDIGELQVKITGDASPLQESLEGVSKLLEGFGEGLAILGVATGLEEIAKEALAAYSAIQSATVSLTALTGSATAANEIIEQMKELSLSEALSFPGLVEAAQRMTAMGFELDQIPGALAAAGDAAKALDSDISSTANAMDRMALSGQATTRNLNTLGVSTADLATAMGIASDQVQEAFKNMDQSDRLNVLTSALSKFAEVGVESAQTLAGQWQNFKTQTDLVFEDLGKQLAPLAVQVLSFLQDDIIPLAKYVVETAAPAFQQLLSVVGDAVKTFKDFGSAAVDLYNSLGPIKDVISAVVEQVGKLSSSTGIVSKALDILVPQFNQINGVIKAMTAGMEDAAGKTDEVQVSSDKLAPTLTAEAKAALDTAAGHKQAALDAANHAAALAALGTVVTEVKDGLQLIAEAIPKIDLSTFEGQISLAAKAILQMTQAAEDFGTKMPTVVLPILQDLSIDVLASVQAVNDLTSATQNSLQVFASLGAGIQATGGLTNDFTAIMKNAGVQTEQSLHDVADRLQDTLDRLHTLESLGFPISQADIDNVARALEQAAEKTDDVVGYMRNLADSATTVGEILAAMGVKGVDALQAEQDALAAVIAKMEDLGATVEQLEPLLQKFDDLQTKIDDFGDHAESAAKQAKSAFQDFSDTLDKSLSKGLIDFFAGNNQNSSLDQQISDLKSKLSDQTAAWTAYQQNIAAQMQAAQQASDTDLAQQLAALQQTLNDKISAYNDYAATIKQKESDITATNDKAESDAIDKLNASLAQKEADYQTYSENIASQIQDLQQASAESLASDLENLQQQLRDKTESYDDFVSKTNTSISRIGLTNQQNIADDATKTQRNIDDKTTAYDRFQDDTLTKIAELKAAGKDESDQQIIDLRTALERKKEDLDTYTQRAKDDLKTYTDEHNAQAQQQTDDLKTQLAIQTRDYNEYVAQNQATAASDTAKNKEQLDKQISNLNDQLAAKKAALDQAEKDTAAQIQATTDKYTQSTATQVAALEAQLAAQKAALDTYANVTYPAAVQKQVDAHAAALAKQEQALQDSLTKQGASYAQFVSDTEDKIADLQTKYTTFWSTIQDAGSKALEKLGTDVLESFFKPFTDAIAKFLAGAMADLLGKLGLGGLSDMLSGIADKIGSIFTGGGSASGGGGSAGGAGGAAGAAAGGVLPIINTAITVGNDIYQGVQLQRLADLLGEIEVTTRGQLNQLVSIQNTMNSYLPYMPQYFIFDYQVLFPLLTGMSGNLYAIAANGVPGGKGVAAVDPGIAQAFAATLGTITGFFSDIDFYEKSNLVELQGIHGVITDQLTKIAAALNPSLFKTWLDGLIGGAGGLGGSLGGITGGAGGALGGLVGGLDGPRMENTLNAIEESTRYVKIWTGEQSQNILWCVQKMAEYTYYMSANLPTQNQQLGTIGQNIVYVLGQMTDIIAPALWAIQAATETTASGNTGGQSSSAMSMDIHALLIHVTDDVQPMLERTAVASEGILAELKGMIELGLRNIAIDILNIGKGSGAPAGAPSGYGTLFGPGGLFDPILATGAPGSGQTGPRGSGPPPTGGTPITSTSGAGNRGTMHVHVNVDGREVANAMVNYLEGTGTTI